MAGESLLSKLNKWSVTGGLAQLSRTQNDSCFELSSNANTMSLPVGLPFDNDAYAETTNSVADFANVNLESAIQFRNWESSIMSSKTVDLDEKFKNYHATLDKRVQLCDEISEKVSEAKGQLHRLQGQYVSVTTKTNSLHEDCEQLMAEQTRLVNFTENMGEKLSYFVDYEKISAKINILTVNSVTNESFLPMLTRIDECIIFLKGKKNYKDSLEYVHRYRGCLKNALDLITEYVSSLLRQSTQQILHKRSNQNATDSENDNAFTLLYGKFRANASKIKRLVVELENRITVTSEYGDALRYCHEVYMEQRIILSESVTSAIQELSTKYPRDHCAFIRSGCSLILRVCQDEYQLFYHFFAQKTPLLDRMLEQYYCSGLYDYFRPLIIHIQHLETLAELCSILKVEMIEEHVLDQDGGDLEALGNVCRQILADVQERLVYRTHMYIRADILNYNPAPGDLAYPEKLEMMESIARNVEKEQQKSQTKTADNTDVRNFQSSLPAAHSNMPMSPADIHGMWYPTVRRTLVCLSKLSRCIDTTTFQGLSQEILSVCVQSLLQASQSIEQKKSQLDAQLFLMKHLLILREQIAPFQVDFSVSETSLDFTKIKDAALGLVRNRYRLLSLNSSNAILQFILDGTPEETVQLLDSRKDVDNQLKNICEAFIRHVSGQVLLQMNVFFQQIDSAQQSAKETGSKVIIRNQPFATPTKCYEIVTETFRSVRLKLPVIRNSMKLYLSNADTENILFKPIRMNIQQAFRQMLDILQKHYTEEDRQIIACPSIDQVTLTLSETAPADSSAISSDHRSRKFNENQNKVTPIVTTTIATMKMDDKNDVDVMTVSDNENIMKHEHRVSDSDDNEDEKLLEQFVKHKEKRSIDDTSDDIYNDAILNGEVDINVDDGR